MIDLKEILYTGLFVDDSQKLLNIFPPKHKNVFGHHSTIWYKPKSLNNLEVGKECLLKIVGRVFDEKGDAVLVDNPSSKKKYPHITISCADGIPPVYSDQLIKNAKHNDTIEIFDEPKYIEVTEGYVDYENRKHIT